MPWSQIRSTAVVALVALLVVVGSAAAPVAAIDGADTTETEDSAEDDEFPEEVCTDVTHLVADEVPFDQVIWIDDLPEELQPDNVPANLVTPRTVASLARGVVPNQCEVFDPNDPTYDPREDDVDPDGDADVVESGDGSTLIVVNGTLNRSADGPGFEVLVETVPEENGEVDPEARINDGEKDYVVDPGVQYWDDGTVYLENDVVVLGKRAGVEFDCNGEECQPDVRGVPHLVDYPTIPSHSDEDHTSDGQADGNDESDSDDTDPTDTTDTTDTTDADDTEDVDDGSDDESDAGTDDGADDDGSDDGDDESSDSGDESDDADDVTETADDGSGDDADQPAQAAAQGDGPGFGAALAGLSVLIATLLARRRFA